jgi:putative heme-binding domain-containing protein
VFAKTCQQCHTLFGTGAKIGPELTGSNRADLDYLLTNIVDPSELIGKDYQPIVIATVDGRLLTGIVQNEDDVSVTLATANETVTVPKDEIDERVLSSKSMMPDDILKPLTEYEVRSLVAYLASPVQVPMLATAESALSLFNGRDLTGWRGDRRLWSVEHPQGGESESGGGEIVGRTTGLERNAFLTGELLTGNFRLSLDVKLLGNRGNSGVQFRSTPLPSGAVEGYQADIGRGWWGKLYEEHGRGLLWEKSGESHVRPDQWNRYQIVAVGSRIRTWINGHLCVDLDDPRGARQGVFALQLHAGGPTEVRFRNFALELNPKIELAVKRD